MKKLLNCLPGRAFGIGKMGDNLTVTILSLERPLLTIKLLESFQTHIPFFKGRFLIIDNGSSRNTFQKLEDYQYVSNQNIKIISAKTNLGVAGGRNYAMQFVETDWVMFLDNDIYIDSSFLPILYDEINELGCHFISLPLKNPNGSFFAKGGQLHISNLHNHALHIGGGSAQGKLIKPEYGSFLFGGASVVNVATFKKIGKFNQNLFICFEDTEFSMRLWKDGYKVGNSTVSCFIHDHPVSTQEEDILYEKKRYSGSHILRSAEYAKKEHYFTFLSQNDINWLQSKLDIYKQSLNISADIKTESLEDKDNKISIAIIIDVIDWAFANIAFNLLNIQQGKFKFIVVPYNDSQTFNDNALHILLTTSNCKIIHFMWRFHAFNFAKEIDRCSSYLDSYAIKNLYLKNKIISTCVYDHLHIPSESSSTLKSFQKKIKQNYYVSSQKLFTIYSQIEGLEKPLAICPDGVDLRLFKMQNPQKFDSLLLQNRKIIIGWAGNSKFGKNDHKGLHTIIKPALKMLQEAGYVFDFEMADRNIIWRTQNDMPDFYNNIDILLCASSSEGTPNIVLEAMACGVTVITTDVGIVREVLGPNQQYFIVGRSVNDFFNKIKLLLNNRYLLHILQKENLEYIKKCDWSIKGHELVDYFNKLEVLN